MLVFLLKALVLYAVVAAIVGAILGPRPDEILPFLREARPEDDERPPVASGSGFSAIFGLLDRLVQGIQGAWYGFWRGLWYGPVQLALVWAIVGGAAVLSVLEAIGRVVDRVIGWGERAIVVVAMFGMTALAFNEFLQRDFRRKLADMQAAGMVSADFDPTMGGLWDIEGQLPVALLLMVVVGFVGGSIATQEGKHLTIDAIDRVLSPPSARFVKRLTSLIAAGVCYQFAMGSWAAVTTHSQDAFEGAKVWSWMAAPINGLVGFMPGEKYGPGTDFKNSDAFIDSKFDAMDKVESSLSAAKKALKADPAEAGDELEAAIESVQAFDPHNNYDLISGLQDTILQAAAGEPQVMATFQAASKAIKKVDPFDMHAFGIVEAGDRFPLWVPLLLLVVTFLMMAARFGVQALYPPDPEMGRKPTVDGTRRPVDVILAGAFPGAVIALGLGAYYGAGPLILVGSIMLVFLGSPLFVAIAVGTIASWVLIRNGTPENVISDMFEATKKQELLAIPFFVLAGNLMTRGTIATRLIDFARALVGFIPGGLGVGAVAACAFFAAISGSSPVTVIAIGTILFPMLLKEGYSEEYSIGVLSSAGSLGIIIPPSIPMIVYAIIVGGSPAIGGMDPAVLFKAGILPGLFIALVLSAYTMFMHWPRSERQWTRHAEVAADVPPLLSATLKGIPSLMLPVLILGGIYGWFSLEIGGIDLSISFSVTEAAAAAVVYALFVELVLNRELKLKDLPEVVTESAVMMGSLFLILVIAISLNRFFVFQQVPEAATAWMMERVTSPLTFLIMVNLFLLALGMVMDILSAILIVAPLLAPIAAGYGIHPIHFGIMFIVNLELGYLTPPMGINLFVASSVFERPILDVIKAVVPFVLLMLFCLIVIIWVPQLSLFLIE